MEKPIFDFVEHNDNWVSVFEEEKELLADVFNDILIRIEHFGSTSIPDISAKPIIDIFVFVLNMENIEDYDASMISRGYESRGIQELSGCKVFVKKNKLNRATHKVNICKEGNQFSIGALLFRDYLRINKKTRIKYEKLKKELYQKHFNNQYAYGDGKQSFIKDTIEKAKLYFT
ncbi:MAG: GrpB family protein [Oscillospiraceae bacterium]